MTATAPCPRCGAANPPQAVACAACLAELGDPSGVRPDRASGFIGDPQLAGAAATLATHTPTAASPVKAAPSRLRRPLTAAGATLSIVALGALAIYEIHRTMPPLPPGFERIARPQGVPTPIGGDEARWRHLQRPEPGTGIAVTMPTGPSGASPGRAAPLARGAAAVDGTSQPSPPAVSPRPAVIARSERVEARAGERLAGLRQAQCGDQALLARVVCNERVRLRFCRGRWNAHPDCEVSVPEALN